METFSHSVGGFLKAALLPAKDSSTMEPTKDAWYQRPANLANVLTFAAAMLILLCQGIIHQTRTDDDIASLKVGQAAILDRNREYDRLITQFAQHDGIQSQRLDNEIETNKEFRNDMREFMKQFQKGK